ncbi:MAG TPA: hypothetical protein VD967_02290 [Candidatus Paceibacterota bacterium]|nr:hypothetical protein [Candidatus Paceibacterota bacterium]
MKYLAIAMLLLIPGFVLSHADGKSFEAKTPDGYAIDIGYSELPQAGIATTFDFNVRDAEGKAVSFDQIWVRIGKGPATYVATGLAKASIGKTVLTYRFPGSGTYEMEVRFERDGKSLAEHTFSLNPQAMQIDTNTGGLLAPLSQPGLLSVSVAFLLGGALTYLFLRRKYG